MTRSHNDANPRTKRRRPRRVLFPLALAAAITTVGNVAAAATPAGSSPRPERDASSSAEDAEAVAEMLHPRVTMVQPFALSGDREDSARFEGEEQVLAYVQRVFIGGPACATTGAGEQ